MSFNRVPPPPLGDESGRMADNSLMDNVGGRSTSGVFMDEAGMHDPHPTFDDTAMSPEFGVVHPQGSRNGAGASSSSGRPTPRGEKGAAVEFPAAAVRTSNSVFFRLPPDHQDRPSYSPLAAAASGGNVRGRAAAQQVLNAPVSGNPSLRFVVPGNNAQTQSNPLQHDTPAAQATTPYNANNSFVTAGQQSFAECYPVKKRSVLITRNMGYKSVLDDERPAPAVTFAPEGTFDGTVTNSCSGSAEDSYVMQNQKPVNQKTAGSAFRLEKLDPESNPDIDDALRGYEFFIGEGEEAPPAASRPEREGEEEEELSRMNTDANTLDNDAPVPSIKNEPFGGSVSSQPLGRETSERLQPEEAAALVKGLSRSFAIQRSVFGGSGAAVPNAPFGGEAFQDTGDFDPDFDYYVNMVMPEAHRCTHIEDLDVDSPSFGSFLQCFKADVVKKNLLYSFRICLFCTFPTLLLVEHPKTKDWFVTGALIPVMGSLSVREPVSIGMQCLMTVCFLQGCTVLMCFSLVMNAVGTVNNTSGWWCACLAASFAAGLLGDMLVKRLLVLMTIIALQLQHVQGGTSLLFSLKLTRDIVLAGGFAMVAVILPFPTFTYKMANEAIHGLHKLEALALGNVLKAYWAPVLVDAKIAYHQLPFARIRDLMGKTRRLLMLCRYEPVEFNLTNILRGERLGFLLKIMNLTYALAAAASQRLDEPYLTADSIHHNELREFEKTMSDASRTLGREIISVLMTVGACIKPEDVVSKVNYDAMCEKAQLLSDLLSQKRSEMLYVKKLSVSESNFFMRTFTFCDGLLDIAWELQQLEQRSKNFDASKYPSFWRRAYNFFFFEMWTDFWNELPKRLTMATARDVRLWKDSLRYSLGFTVACAFTLQYDRSNIYYFGMAILVRMAQQTASETLFIGMQRICGLCIGASLAYITTEKTHNLAEKILLTMTWQFIALCFGLSPQYGQMALYVAVISITGLSLAPVPSLLLTRITDNVFAFIAYFLICVVIFPVDPVRMQWNMRTRCFIRMNDIAQEFVTIACAPITVSGEEVEFLVKGARGLLAETKGYLAQYTDWMTKSANEPIIRGATYPSKGVAQVLSALCEIHGLNETLMEALARLHRRRDKMPGTILHDMMELVRPFLLDVGKLYHLFFQEMINSTEKPLKWTMEPSVRVLWKAELACRSLRQVTGNVQKNFYAAVQQVSGVDRKQLNQYINSTIMEDAMMKGLTPHALNNPENEDMIQRLFALSFHMSYDNLLSRDDTQAFNTIVIVFELHLKILFQVLLPMLEIHEFEKSRVL